jgi:uncharacterized protein (DUF2252 family)
MPFSSPVPFRTAATGESSMSKSSIPKTADKVETSDSLRSHPTRSELLAMGKSLREKCPRQDHAHWTLPLKRPDPVQLILEANEGRMPHLIPIRHGRLLHSPFSYYRGTALNMVVDLAGTPNSGLRVQACGDCHLMNFGAFATPERRIIFDINDLDETLPAPWEWDVKRLAASIHIASRHNGFREDQARAAVLECVRSYRERMDEYSQMTILDVWYARIDVEDLIPGIVNEKARARAQKRLKSARERSVLEHEFPELAISEGLTPSIRENPPLIFHLREASHEIQMAHFHEAFAQYRDTLQEDRRLVLDRFKVLDIAVKVVGVGSVGTLCGIILLMAGDRDPLFLQVKQARRSVLEDHAGKSRHPNDGQRIVHGHRMMQSASDLFLGWAEGHQGAHFYVRQLRDMKVKPMVEVFTPIDMEQYAAWCGWTIAHCHARSGEPAKIVGYLGKSDRFDEAIADFAAAYADQTEQDYDLLLKAARDGKIEVFIEQE